MDRKIIKVDSIIECLQKKKVSYTYSGKDDIWVDRLSSLNKPGSNSLYWIKNENKIKNMAECDGYSDSIFIIPKDMPFDKTNCGVIGCDNPKQVLGMILDEFWNQNSPIGIGKSSKVEASSIGKNVSIGEHCYISPETVIGDNVIIGNNVTIMNNARIGNDCIIHSGVVIGEDGLGMSIDENGIPIKIRQYGDVYIEDRVEIFANASVMRGAIDSTRIGHDCKIGVASSIGHNVQIGSCSMIMGGVIICGSVHIGEAVYISPGTVIKNQVMIGNDAFIGMGVTIDFNVEENEAVVSDAKCKRKRNGAKILRQLVGIYSN